MGLYLTPGQVADGWPYALEALPSSYRSDDVLEFEVSDGTLYTRPLHSEELARKWEVYWDLLSESWTDPVTGLPVT